MTRDKLRTKSFDHTGRQWYYKTEVDKLLNDFESRTCENCIYYIPNTMFDSIGDLDCSANNMAQNIVSFPPSDFGCNKWEAKTVSTDTKEIR